MKMTSVLLLLSFILACSTSYDLKHSKPKITYTTTRPAAEVAKCITKKWGEDMSPVEQEKTANGFIIRHFDVTPSAMIALVTVEGTEPNVEVKYYNKNKMFKLHQAEEAVEGCK